MYRPAIDGLTAIAIIGVLLVHAGAPGASLGWLGVDLFFVLSGFLITTLLINENEKSGRIDLIKFMGRRSLRLFPAYYLYVSLITISIYFGFGTVSSIGEWDPTLIIASLWGYFNNYIPRGGFWEYDKLLIHLWSLSIEEQYYLIWPLVLVFSLKMKNNLLIPFLLVIALLIVRTVFHEGLDVDDKLYTRGFALFVGSYVAMLFLYKQRLSKLFIANKTLLFSIVIGGVLALSLLKLYGFIDDHGIRQNPIIALDIALALLIASVWYGEAGASSKVLSHPILVYIGKVSYGIYLYHMFSHFIVRDVIYPNFDSLPNSVNYLMRLVLYFSFSLLLATLSYKYIEASFLRLKSRLR